MRVRVVEVVSLEISLECQEVDPWEWEWLTRLVTSRRMLRAPKIVVTTKSKPKESNRK